MADELKSRGSAVTHEPLCEGPIIGPPADAGEQLADQLRQWMLANGMLKGSDEKPTSI